MKHTIAKLTLDDIDLIDDIVTSELSAPPVTERYKSSLLALCNKINCLRLPVIEQYQDSYIDSQIAVLGDFEHKLQMTGKDGQSKWLNITPETLATIHTALTLQSHLKDQDNDS